LVVTTDLQSAQVIGIKQRLMKPQIEIIQGKKKRQVAEIVEDGFQQLETTEEEDNLQQMLKNVKKLGSSLETVSETHPKKLFAPSTLLGEATEMPASVVNLEIQSEAATTPKLNSMFIRCWQELVRIVVSMARNLS